MRLDQLTRAAHWPVQADRILAMLRELVVRVEQIEMTRAIREREALPPERIH
jgi:hypothetical protein